MKEQIEEIFKTKGGKLFFHELNAARIPFFFIAAIENTEDKTEYFCETITPGTMGIRLSDDKFADHLNIQNHGFTTIPAINPGSQGAQGQDPGGEPGTMGNGGVLPADERTEADNNMAVLRLLDFVTKLSF